MTYRKLEKLIANLSEEQKDTDVRHLDPDKRVYYRLGCLSIASEKEGDTLPDGTPFLEG